MEAVAPRAAPAAGAASCTGPAQPAPSRAGGAKIEVRGLGKSFTLNNERIEAVRDFDLTIATGEFVSIVGPSGCGKSTLLRILAGLDRHTTGTASIRREDRTRPLLNMIFQEQSAFPWMRVADNVAYGLRMRRERPAVIAERVDYWLRAVGLERFARAFPYQLSGGMRQRVAIARAFANDPEILLMDEPFAALDALTKTVMQDELLRLWEDTRKTVAYVTHSLEEALALSDRIVVMTARPGQIKAIIPVPFGRPREGVAIKSDPRYGALYSEIWNLLHEEVVKPQVADAH
jgi:NitT/TauT family transport system ATP-binding protein